MRERGNDGERDTEVARETMTESQRGGEERGSDGEESFVVYLRVYESFQFLFSAK